MRKTILPSLVFLLTLPLAHSQTDNGVFSMREFTKPKKREIIHIPDVGPYQVLKADFHMHTVFSDGHVWPHVRIQEAWNEGIDAISITEHVEYTPHQADVRIDHNRTYELGKARAEEHNLIFIKGTEITRDTPPGHFNALFIGDASEYIAERGTNERDWEAIKKAIDQNAFIFWDHPGWRASTIEGSYEWVDFVDRVYTEGALGGIEVFNGFGFHKKALDWAIEKDLTVIGSTDLHNLVAHEYNRDLDYVRRTMTLVLAKERTSKGIREALEAGRTVAWASKYLAGKEEHIRSLFNACVNISPAYHTRKDRDGNSTYYYEISNKSDLYFELDLVGGTGTPNVTLYPFSSQIITTSTAQQTLIYSIPTTFIGGGKHMEVSLELAH